LALGYPFVVKIGYDIKRGLWMYKIHIQGHFLDPLPTI